MRGRTREGDEILHSMRNTTREVNGQGLGKPDFENNPFTIRLSEPLQILYFCMRVSLQLTIKRSRKRGHGISSVSMLTAGRDF
jgi:hypothetical protein